MSKNINNPTLDEAYAKGLTAEQLEHLLKKKKFKQQRGKFVRIEGFYPPTWKLIKQQ